MTFLASRKTSQGRGRLRRATNRYGDRTVAVILAAAVVAELLTRADGRSWPALGAAALATLPLAARRRLPLPAFWLSFAGMVALVRAAPSMYSTSASFIAVSVWALFGVGAYAVGVHFWLGLATVCAAVVVAQLGDGSGFTAGNLMFLAVFLGTPWASGVGYRLYRERKAADATETARLVAEQTTRSTAARDAERAQIARELHDVVSHAMAVTLMQARGGRRVQASDPQAATAAFDAIEHTNTEAIGDMRRMLNVLRDTPTDPDSPTYAPMPSLQRLPQLLDQVQAAGIDVHLSVDGDLDHVPAGVALSAYRVIQEALTNVVKHAAPAHADVTISCHPDRLDVTVTNDRQELPRPPDHGLDHGPGHGLNGIKERVHVLGGHVNTGATPTGYTVHAHLPYHPTP